MKFFSAFAGIGGFDLGLERAGWQCAGQCEIEPFCVAALEKYWPDVWRWQDVKTLSGQLILEHCGRIDALVGGPPCQPSSVAGQRRGASDDRWLWPDFLRLVSEVKPMWVLAENPRGVLSIDIEGVQFPIWLAGEFAARGYELMPVELAAEDVGAPHRRERVFFLAHDVRRGQCGCERERGRILRIGNGREIPGNDAGWQGEIERLADCNRSWQYESQRSVSDEWRWIEDGGGESMADAACELLNGSGQSRTGRRFESSNRRPCWPSRPGEPQHEWEAPRVIEAQSEMGFADHGLPVNVARWRVAVLKACGNAIVPQVAEVLGRMINRYLEVA